MNPLETFGETTQYGEAENLSPQCLYIENALARLTAAYQKTMLESNTTESFLASEYLIENADQVLDLNQRARALGRDEAEHWLQIIRKRIDRIIYMRRPR